MNFMLIFYFLFLLYFFFLREMVVIIHFLYVGILGDRMISLFENFIFDLNSYYILGFDLFRNLT